jgi:hypothetical protein
VPAAAVIPAPIVYIKVAAVKKLVVGFRNAWVKARPCGVARLALPIFRWGVKLSRIIYFEKIRVFKAGVPCH